MTIISNHPRISSVTRKSKVAKFLDDKELQEIVITCIVYHFGDNAQDISQDISPRQVPLIATMENFVDANGNPAEEGTPEYLYWKSVITSGAIDEDTLYSVVILKADSNNRFD